MNIFILHPHFKINARYYCDKHIIKMITEHCQMLSTCWREKYKDLYSSSEDAINILYKSTHKNHPCNTWLMDDINNVIYLIFLTEYLLDEYEYRFEKKDNFINARQILKFIRRELKLPTVYIYEFPKTFVQVMPDKYKTIDKDIFHTSTAYRGYFRNEKSNLFNWTKRDRPDWLN